MPVKYVVYSHHHQDHASGGEVYGDDVTFVGHANLPRILPARTLASAHPTSPSKTA